MGKIGRGSHIIPELVKTGRIVQLGVGAAIDLQPRNQEATGSILVQFQFDS